MHHATIIRSSYLGHVPWQGGALLTSEILKTSSAAFLSMHCLAVCTGGVIIRTGGSILCVTADPDFGFGTSGDARDQSLCS
jgi:hypothetical protein